MNALFIGRFQPFHKGHMKVIKNASKNYDNIIIGIGSSQYANTLENPFTSDERKKMIKNSLEKNNVKNYRIFLIPDIHNPPKWVDHVVSIISDFDLVISNCSFNKNLFEEKCYIVKETPLYERDKYSGKEIRSRIINGKKWEDLVPRSVYDIIRDIDGINRLKKLADN